MYIINIQKDFVKNLIKKPFIFREEKEKVEEERKTENKNKKVNISILI